MEKLDLKKFEDSKLTEHRLANIRAGDSSTCTGGGVGQDPHACGYIIYSYDSDSINESGAIFYNGWQESFYIPGVHSFQEMIQTINHHNSHTH